jgi:cysteinyl-tRNA synthetase
MKVYNTLSRKKETFSPISSKQVTFYACGLTVYDYPHIGNLRKYIFDDILKRVLLYNKYKVKHIENVTDVGHLTSDADAGEDKIVKGLKREKLPLTEKSMLTLTQKYFDSYKEDRELLNILPPQEWTKATEHVQEMIDMIAKILKNKHAYETETAIYFDITSFKHYSDLAKLKLEELEAGARVEVDKGKKHPYDFVLWFKAVGKHKNHLMTWDSPFGKGFPGWHIECSAMATKYLGKQFDIHTGGMDHIPVHHTNEIAQTEAATKKHHWVKYWLHSGFLTDKDGEKVSKSKGGLFTLKELMAKGYDPLAYRYLCLTAQYRKPLSFSMKAMDGAKNSLYKLQNKVLELLQQKKQDGSKSAEEYIETFQESIDDDLNTPQALAAMWEMLKDENVDSEERYEVLLNFDRVLGLDLDKIKKIEVPQEVASLLEQREHARLHKNWDDADDIRDKIEELGYVIDDTDSGPIIKKA